MGDSAYGCDDSYAPGAGAGGVYALEAATGDNIWHFETEYWGHSSPAVIGGVVYVGSTDGYVYSITEE